jgi:hypothetical protein
MTWNLPRLRAPLLRLALGTFINIAGLAAVIVRAVSGWLG